MQCRGRIDYVCKPQPFCFIAINLIPYTEWDKYIHYHMYIIHDKTYLLSSSRIFFASSCEYKKRGVKNSLTQNRFEWKNLIQINYNQNLPSLDRKKIRLRKETMENFTENFLLNHHVFHLKAYEIFFCYSCFVSTFTLRK